MLHYSEYSTWILVIIIIIFFVYIIFYISPCKNPELIQLPSALCSSQILAEKNPILISDKSLNRYDLLNTVFKFQYVHASKLALLTSPEILDARFTIITLTSSSIPSNSAYIDITHPLNNNNVVRIIMHGREALILPPMWIIQKCEPGALQVLKLYDLFHLIKYLVCSKKVP